MPCSPSRSRFPAFASLVAGPAFGPGPRARRSPGSADDRPRMRCRRFTRSLSSPPRFLPLAFRRRFPLSVLAVTSVAAAVYELTNNPPSMVFVAPLVALYTVGTLRDRRTSAYRRRAFGGCRGGHLAAGDLRATDFWPNLVRILSTYGVAAALGEATRNRRAYVAEVERRAVDAEQNREEEARRRVDEERLRIARELHDVTAHSLSIVAVQSGAALHVLDTDPAAARKSAGGDSADQQGCPRRASRDAGRAAAAGRHGCAARARARAEPNRRPGGARCATPVTRYSRTTRLRHRRDSSGGRLLGVSHRRRRRSRMWSVMPAYASCRPHACADEADTLHGARGRRRTLDLLRPNSRRATG